MKSTSISYWPHAEIIITLWIIFKRNGYKMAYKNIRYYDSMYPFNNISNIQGILSMLSAMLSALYMLLLGNSTEETEAERRWLICLTSNSWLSEFEPGTLTPNLDT